MDALFFVARRVQFARFRPGSAGAAPAGCGEAARRRAEGDERIVGAMLSLYDELRALSAAFDAGGVDYALCGGLALAVHGHPRATKDIDVLVRPEDLALARSIARACGFVLASLPIRFPDTGVELERVSKIVGTDVLMLDLLVAKEPLLAAWGSRRRYAWGGGDLAVVSREALVSMKLAAGRPQDLADLAKLAESE